MLAHLHLSYLWCVELGAHGLDEIGGLLRTAPALVERLVAAGGCRIAESADGVAGAAGWEPLGSSVEAGMLVDEGGRPIRLGQPREAALIWTLFVDPTRRKLDLVRRLLGEVELTAARAGQSLADVVALHESWAIYQALGYSPVRSLRLKLDERASLPATHLRKSLTARLARAA